MPRAESAGFARLTPAGRAALAVFALRGRLPSPSPLRSPSGGTRSWPAPGEVVHARLVVDGRPVDDLVARGTAEGVELHVHGGDGVLDLLEDALSCLGVSRDDRVPLAAPTSLRHARALASTRWGLLAALGDDARRALAAGALPPGLRTRLRASRECVALGRRLARPPVVRLVGRPNAGKSTLFNALLSDDRALVSPRAGTTRDTVTATLRLCGAVVRLEDTAGADGAHDAADGADLLVHVLDPCDTSPVPVTEHAQDGTPVLVVLGKDDLRGAPTSPTSAAGFPRVSGLTGTGVDELLRRLARRLALDGPGHDDVLAPLDDGMVRLIDAALALPDGEASPA
ncbi:MAG: 50S ribosome-binding GTPase [Planctomycetes bacterium]|nr:50S ribosome-binding GTPase [Planctomycetota bacterium]